MTTKVLLTLTQDRIFIQHLVNIYSIQETIRIDLDGTGYWDTYEICKYTPKVPIYSSTALVYKKLRKYNRLCMKFMKDINNLTTEDVDDA